jgi:hypothetical protein
MNGEEMTINDTNTKNHFIMMGRGKNSDKYIKYNHKTHMDGS